MPTSEGKVKKPLWRALGIVAGVLAGLFAVLMVVVHIVLSPKVATNLVNKYAPEFIDGDLTFGEVKVSMFRHFPNLTLTLKDADLTYPHDRFAAYENGNYMMRQGVEPGTAEALQAYVSCLHQMYLMGACVQLHRLGYHMVKM